MEANYFTILKENREINLCDLGIDKNILDSISKAWSIKEQMDYQTSSRFKTSSGKTFKMKTKATD